MNEIKEYTLDEAKQYIKSINRKRVKFYCNFYGWSFYYTLEPTFATPNGLNKDFPRFKMITL